MIAMLKRPDETKDRDEGGVILRKLNKNQRESYNHALNEQPFVAINKKWLFDWEGAHFEQSKREISYRVFKSKLAIWIKYHP